LILAVHVLLGLLLASWSFFVAAPFGKSPQLAAVVTTVLSFIFVIIALVMSHAGNGAAFIFTIIFPPGFYVFAIRAIAGYENHLLPTNALKGDPDNDLMLLPLLIAAIASISSQPNHGIIFDFLPSRSIFSFGPTLLYCWRESCTMPRIRHQILGCFGGDEKRSI
jgi:ATP-binding cassette subfamily A (ABC1) protein 3